VRIAIVMPRKLKVEVIALTGAVAECVIWVNHNLVVDDAPPASWEGKIPSAPTPITVEVSGVGAPTYRVTLTVDDQVVTKADNQLQEGADVFNKTV
jgi:hypothetical protein